MRFVTVFRGGGGMFFVIIGRSSNVPIFRRQRVNSFSFAGMVCVFSNLRAKSGRNRVSCSSFSFSFSLRAVRLSVFSALFSTAIPRG